MATKVINSLTFGDTYVLTTPYATCSTNGATTAKVATITPGSNFSLETGARVSVKFDAANITSSPTLNVNQSGAKTIRFRGAALTSSLYNWAAGSVVDFVYDGTYWNMTGAPDNTNSLAPSGVTAGTYGPSANVSGTNNTTINVPEITVDTYGRITSITNRIYTSQDTHHTTKLVATSSAGTDHAATTNGNTYLRLFDDSTARQSIKITGGGATIVTSDTSGVITISSTDTRVMQNAATTTSGNYPVILGNSTATTAVTGSVNKSANLLFDPSSSTLIVGSTETSGNESEPVGNLYVSGDAIIGGGSDSFGIIPGQDNYSHVGTSDRRWYQGYFSQLYCNNYFTSDGNLLTSQFLPTSGGTLTGATTVNAGVALQLNKLKIPTSSGGSTYGVGSSGQVLKSNGSTVYWATDSNTTYSYPNLIGCSCSTSASTTAKTATLTGFSSTYLKAGATVFVRFTYAHTGTSAATLNVNSSGAKTIYRNGKTITSANANSWTAYEVVKMVYDGTYWQYTDTQLTWNTF